MVQMYTKMIPLHMYIHVCVYIFFLIFFSVMVLQDIKCSSLCFAIGPVAYFIDTSVYMLIPTS